MIRSNLIAAGLASLALSLSTTSASADAPPVPLGGTPYASSTGPTVGDTALGPGNCGVQVPNGAVVHKDGSITDVNGQPLAGNIVCSPTDIANNSTTNGSTLSAARSTSLTQAAVISTATSYVTEEAFQQAYPGGNGATGWYSFTSTITVPSDPNPNSQSTVVRFFSGLNDNSTVSPDHVVITGTLQYQNGGFTVFAMFESVGSPTENTYSPSIPAQPGDIITVTVQQAPQFLYWNATISNSRTNDSRTLNVQYDPAMIWAISAMDAENNPPTRPLDNCGQLPSFPSVHFGSPHLVEDTGEHMPGQNIPYAPGFFNTANGNHQPSCSWNNWGQNDNGNGAGYTDIIWNCTPSYTCGQCGLVPVACINDQVNCGGCGTGLVCGSNNVCTTPCQPLTCAAYEQTCGSAPDQCGGTLNCGTCVGSRNACVGKACQCNSPLTCASVGKTCGTMDNGCGVTLTCGSPCAGPPPAPAVPRKGTAALSLLLAGLGAALVKRSSKRSRSSEAS